MADNSRSVVCSSRCGPQQFFFLLSSATPEQANLRPHTFLSGHLLQIDLAVEPVQLLAQMANSLRQFTALVVARLERVGAKCHEVGQATGLGLLHVLKRRLHPLGIRGGRRVVLCRAAAVILHGQCDQALVNEQLVLEEGDLQIVAVQLAAHLLQPSVRLLERREGGAGLSDSLFDLPQQPESSMLERRQLLTLETAQRCPCTGSGLLHVVQIEMQAGDQQLAHDGPRLGIGTCEGQQRLASQRHRLVHTTLAGQYHGTVEVDQGRPQPVLFSQEDPAGLVEQAQRQVGLAAMAHGDRSIGQRLSGFQRQLLAFESAKGRPRQLHRLLGQIELEIGLRETEVAHGAVVVVAQLFGLLAGQSVEPDRLRIFATQVMKIARVVVDLHDEPRKILALTEGTALLVRLEGLPKVEQVGVAHRDVTKANGGIACPVQRQELAMGSPVKAEGLLPLILTREDYREVVIQDCQAQTIAECLKHLPRLRFPSVDVLIVTQIGQIMETRGACDRGRNLVVQIEEAVKRSLVVLLGLLVLAGKVVCVGGRAS